MSQPKLRVATKSDQDEIIALIDSVYREYGDKICLSDADADLNDIEQNYLQNQGAFVVMELDSKVIGTHAVLPLDVQQGICTFRRLYLHPEYRGGDSGAKLMDWAIEEARDRHYNRVEFWSDTRFQRAHQFFRKLGFQTNGETRLMQDAFEPYEEFRFWLDLNSVPADSKES